MSKEKQCECCHEWWYDSDVKENLCPNCYDYFKQLKRQLKEKDNLIEFGREEIRKRNKRIDEIVERDKKLFDDKNKELEKLKQQLAEKQNTIDEINKEFVQAVHDWKALCAEKDKEIERLKNLFKLNNEVVINQGKEIFDLRVQVLQQKQNQTQLAIQELEKVKAKVRDVSGALALCEVEVQIDQQIKELEGNNNEPR